MGNGGTKSFSVEERGFSKYGGEFMRGRSRGRGEIGFGDDFNKLFLGDRRGANRGHVVSD